MSEVKTQDMSKGVTIHKTKLVDIGKLKPAPYNPPNRTAPENIGDMVESLSKFGQLNNIIIRSDNTIIFGHRRVAAAKHLGWRTLVATIRDDLDMDVMYAEDFATARRMSANDALGVWLKNPRAVPPRQAAWFATMQESLGRPRVMRLFREGYSIQLYRRARQIAKYVEREDDSAWIAKAVDWMIEFGMSGMVQQVMARGGDPMTIRLAIEKGRKLKMEAAFADD
jgi:hypothetical protein